MIRLRSPRLQRKASKSEDSGASPAAEAKAAVGRLTGERAFHLGASTTAGALASRALGTDAPFAPAAGSFPRGADVNGEGALRRGLFASRGYAGNALGGAPFHRSRRRAAPAPAAPRAGLAFDKSRERRASGFA